MKPEYLTPCLWIGSHIRWHANCIAAATPHLADLTRLTAMSLHSMSLRAVTKVLPALAALPSLSSLAPPWLDVSESTFDVEEEEVSDKRYQRLQARVRAFVTCLTACSTLTLLDFEHVREAAEEMAELMDHLPAFSRLVWLRSWSPSHDKAAERLLSSVVHLPRLIHLDLGEQGQPRDTIARLADHASALAGLQPWL
jgi:hypothetical protein